MSIVIFNILVSIVLLEVIFLSFEIMNVFSSLIQKQAEEGKSEVRKFF